MPAAAGAAVLQEEEAAREASRAFREASRAGFSRVDKKCRERGQWLRRSR
jgi:hypothetical protein